MTREEILRALAALRARDLPTHGGRTLAYVYDSGLADADAVGREALALFAGSNGLDPTAFPSLLAMENDLVGLAGRLLHAPDGFVGTVTSGGTESCLLAVLAARDAWRATAGADPDGRRRPRLLVPSTVHAAFHKAGHLFGVDVVVVDVDPRTHRADPDAMAAALTEDTCLVVASAPSYAHGVLDPVPAIAAAAAERGIRCHVDACIGGWVLPHLSSRHPWDFAVPGVTSVSVDLHKYAYTPKGVSILVHRDSSLRLHQLFAFADWPGYPMLNPTIQSTKSGGPLAAAWAVLQHIGVEGYAELACTAREATLEIAAGARGIPGLRVVAEPDSTLVAIATDASCDVFTIADEMLARGWFVQPQLTHRGAPPTLHLTVSAATAPLREEFVSALAEATATARAAGPVPAPRAVVEALAHLDPADLDEQSFAGLLGAAGLAGADGSIDLPERMAPVNALLDAAPPSIRAVLLRAVLDLLARPTPPLP